MNRRVLDFTMCRAGWGRGQSIDLDVGQVEFASDPEGLPNLLRVKASELPPDFLSWPSRSGCALQCLYSLSPVGRGPTILRNAEAVKRSSNTKEVELELVSGWPGEPHYWGNRSVHDEEVEAAIHGLVPSGKIALLSVPGEHDPNGKLRARILKSEDDEAVLFIAHSLEEAQILSGVADRLCDTGMLVPCTSDASSLKGTRMIGTSFRRTDKSAPVITRWLGGHGTRSQHAMERQDRSPWPIPGRWRGVSQ